MLVWEIFGCQLHSDAVVASVTSASKTLVMKGTVLFGISDNDEEHKEGESAKMWRGAVLTEAHGGPGEAHLCLVRYILAIFYTEHVSHHFELLGESRKKNVEWQVWPEGLIYVLSIQSVFSLRFSLLAPGNKTTNRLKCTFFTKLLVHGLLISPDCLRQNQENTNTCANMP